MPVMSKRNVFTTITPLPPSISRKTVIDFFHNHEAMIDLNPLVIERHPIKAPDDASADEASCIWYSLTDKVHYLPGGIAAGNVNYTACFNDLPNGVQTHCRAPASVDIRSLWSIRGSLPGEPKEPMELGLVVPKEGLYIREDVDLRCNFILASFVKKTLKKAHSVLMDRLTASAERKEVDKALSSQFPMGGSSSTTPTPSTTATAPSTNPSRSNVSVQSASSQQQYPPIGAPIAPPGQHPAYLGHPQAPQYGYPPHDPNYPQQYPQHHSPLASPDPRISDPRFSIASSPSTDPRLSYQSVQSYSSYGSQVPPQLSPPGYPPGYGYGAPGPYPPGPPPMGYGYPQNMTYAWHPQHGWYQTSMQPVEIAGPDVAMPPSAAGDIKGVVGEGDKDKKDVKKEESKDAHDDKRLEAYPQQVRPSTFELA
ncbi:hypothetical protein TWF694_011140 [Orbilia ellipsospora]|uniref:DUF7053 domain-containing protein n=1 Tax=Orbilia ellipsospora TaxID=2528407 RepID=A0AAV9X8G0_9PEZI